MQTVEMCFNDTIAKYSLFKQAATLLIEEIPSLTPEAIHLRCADLRTLQQELTDNKDYLFDLMEFMGPGILDTAYIGEFQRALNTSILSCDALYAEILSCQDNLLFSPE